MCSDHTLAGTSDRTLIGVVEAHEILEIVDLRRDPWELCDLSHLSDDAKISLKPISSASYDAIRFKKYGSRHFDPKVRTQT